MSDSILHPLDFKIPTGPGSEAIPLARALKNHLPDFSWGQVRELCHTGKVTVDGDPVHDARRPVEPGMRVVVTPNAPSTVEPEAAPRGPIHILFEDSQVVVIEKPAGISTVPFEEGERNTVLDYVRRTWRALGTTDPRSPLMVVHRLDRDTSGVLVLAKTEPARAILASQFRSHVVEREYLALVHGVVSSPRRTYHSFISSDRGDGLRGSVRPPLIGKEAITHVEVVESLSGATLVRCRLETGRTHQVRIHLSEAGHPIIGETVYIRDFQGVQLPFERLALHAAKLGFKHPRTGRLVRFESPLPSELRELAREFGGAPERAEVKRAAVEAKVNKQHWANEVRDWWKEGPEPGPGAGPAREEKRERISPRPVRNAEHGHRAGTRDQGAARGKQRKEPTGWLEGGPEAPPMGKRPERAAPRFGRGAGEAPVSRPARDDRNDRGGRPDRGDRTDRGGRPDRGGRSDREGRNQGGERPLSASQGRRAQAIERVRAGAHKDERPDTRGDERSSGRSEERSSRAARQPLGGPESGSRENHDRSGPPAGARGGDRGRSPRQGFSGEPSSNRGGYRHSGDREQGGERRGPARRVGVSNEGGERRGPPRREGFSNEGGERRGPPRREGFSHEGGERRGPPRREGFSNEGGERRGPPRREGFSNEGGERRGPPRREGFSHEGGDNRGPRRDSFGGGSGDNRGPRQEGPGGEGGERTPPPRRQGFAGRGEDRRDAQNRDDSRREDSDRTAPPRGEGFAGRGDARRSSSRDERGRSEGPSGWSAPEDRPKAAAGARKKIRTEEPDPKAAGKAQKKKLDALQNEISGLIDNAMKRK